jgi:hypothetical protein
MGIASSARLPQGFFFLAKKVVNQCAQSCSEWITRFGVVEYYGLVLKDQGLSGCRDRKESFIQICRKLGLTWISKILRRSVVTMVRIDGLAVV